ncbi:MAG TPA: GNAT family N-acetyltransferase [Chthoniobacterales bacterium]|nr:GNAT family N-acetyltransferase [Chthoniobacterales bacterium]
MDVRIPTAFGEAIALDHVPKADQSAFVSGFAPYVMDHRYYEITKATLGDQFEHRYLILKDQQKRTRAVQPFLIVRQDLVMGTPAAVRQPVDAVRKLFPGFLKLPMLMVGCSAGEGDIAVDVVSGDTDWTVDALRVALPPLAKRLKAMLVLFKDYPKSYRVKLDRLLGSGFTRIPSMPATGLKLDFRTFDEYLTNKLSHSMRKNLRRKFRKSASGAPINLEVVSDITPYVEDVLPLYRAVFGRAKQRFEELNRPYFCQLGQRMSDRARFLIWRRDDKIVAFASCLVHNGVLKDNYIGLDYSLALEYHLYFVTWRDTVVWAIQNGCHTYHSAPLNYDPKFHFRMHLEPLDLYARATHPLLNACFRPLLPVLEPTRYDKPIQKFENAGELW